MKFYDKISITLQSGKWWDGAVAARREAGIPYGGPRWGNGGDGGSIYLVVDRNLNTLLHLKYKQIRSAKDGERWQSMEKYGRGAEDLYIPIPVGTVIKNHETGQILYQAVNHDDKFQLLSGWAGGIGNMHFKNSVLQYPDFGLKWEPAKSMEVDMEIQLLGDIWLIWFPSVGKSSIINSICNTKAKVAEYHFTTLVPNLGSIKYEWYDYNIVDIPGIIAWANEGKWLWLDFLRHVLKARVFDFVLDISRYDEWILEFGQLRNEIISYCRNSFINSYEFGYLITEVNFDIYMSDDDIVLNITDQNNTTIVAKKLIWTVNKVDEVDDSEIQSEYTSALKKHIYETLVDYIHQWDILTLQSTLDKNIYMTCVIDYDLMQNYKHILTEKLNKWAQILGYITVDLAHIHKEQESYIKDITEEEEIEYDMEHEEDFSRFEESLYHKNYWSKYTRDKTDYDAMESDEVAESLFGEEWFVIPEDDSLESPEEEFVFPEEEEEEFDFAQIPKEQHKTRLIYDPKLNKLVYQMMRWNAQAEHRFWHAIKTMWFIRRFGKKKIKVWDILVFKSNYRKVPNKAVRYWWYGG